MAFTPSDTKYVTDGTLGVDLSLTPTTQDFALGSRVRTNDGGEYLYVQANGAIAQFAAVGIDEDYQAAELTKAMADDGWMIGAAQVAFADNDYGWIAVKGSDVGVKVAASCAADVALYTTGTAGVLDDASTSQTKIEGIVAVTAVTAATSTEVIMTFPRSTGF